MTTPKKLSEIGAKWQQAPEIAPIAFIYTPSERRELVLLALTKWEESKVMAVSYGPTIEKFLEENGI